jgi:DNA-binding NtrC family response regulator
MSEEQKTVLIVDDDKCVLGILELIFRREAYRVLIADEAFDALELLGRERIDAVLLDILMPDKDGIETLIEIRLRFPQLPVIVMSGGGTRRRYDILTLASKFGATRTLQKPLVPSEVTKAVEDAMARAAGSPLPAAHG